MKKYLSLLFILSFLPSACGVLKNAALDQKIEDLDVLIWQIDEDIFQNQDYSEESWTNVHELIIDEIYPLLLSARTVAAFAKGEKLKTTIYLYSNYVETNYRGKTYLAAKDFISYAMKDAQDACDYVGFTWVAGGQTLDTIEAPDEILISQAQIDRASARLEWEVYHTGYAESNTIANYEEAKWEEFSRKKAELTFDPNAGIDKIPGARVYQAFIDETLSDYYENTEPMIQEQIQMMSNMILQSIEGYYQQNAFAKRSIRNGSWDFYEEPEARDILWFGY